MVIFKYIRALMFNHRFKRAKEFAGRMADLYNKPFVVIVFKKRPRVVALGGLRKFVREGHLKDVTENNMTKKIILYRAYPHGRRAKHYVSHTN